MKKNLLRIRAVLLLAFAVMFSGVTSAVNVYAFDNSVREGVVAVVVYMEDVTYYAKIDGEYVEYDSYAWSMNFGSGFFVGGSGDEPQYIVTNHHVVSNYIAAGEGTTGAKLPTGDKVYNKNTGKEYDKYIAVNGTCELRVYYSEDDYDVAYVDCYGDRSKVDLAVIRLRNPTDKRRTLQIAIPSDDMVGDTVYTIGFPGNADNDFTGASKYGIEDATVHKGSINKFVVNDGVGVERIAVDATIQHGNSGGPLVNEDGYVIGVNTNVESNSPYANQIEVDYYAINASELVRFLGKNNIPYEMADSKSGGGNSGGSSGGSSGGNSNGIIIAIAAVVIIGAVVFVLWKKGLINTGNNVGASVNKAAGSTAGNGAAVSSGTAVKKAVIRSLSAQHNGKVYPVGKAPVTIGRNAAGCEIVYNEGTPGVSGMHCTVSYDSATGIFTLTDLKSSYGTFLMNGTKLNANAPVNLKPGDSFYVGDRANVLRVEVEQ